MEPYKSYGRNQNPCGPNNRNMNSCNMGNRGHASRNTQSSRECEYPSLRKVECECQDENQHMRHMNVGMAYVPMQSWECLSDPETALREGTAFPSLNLVFCGVRGKK